MQGNGVVYLTMLAPSHQGQPPYIKVVIWFIVTIYIFSKKASMEGAKLSSMVIWFSALNVSIIRI